MSPLRLARCGWELQHTIRLLRTIAQRVLLGQLFAGPQVLSVFVHDITCWELL